MRRLVLLLALALVACDEPKGASPDVGPATPSSGSASAVADAELARWIADLPADLETQAIVPTGGVVTEILCALGAQQQLVAIDSTSVWPASVKKLPSVGYVRALSAEGIIALEPSLVLSTTEAGPKAALDQLASAGLPVVQLPGEKGDKTVATLERRILAIGHLLGAAPAARKLAEAVRSDLAAARAVVARHEPGKVLMLFGPRPGSLMVAGEGSGGATLLAEIGLASAHGEIRGYKPVSAEGLATMQPELILVAAHQGTGLTPAQVAGMAGVAQTPAGQQQRIIVVDSVRFLAGGPRMGEAALELVKTLWPEADVPASATTPLMRAAVEGP